MPPFYDNTPIRSDTYGGTGGAPARNKSINFFTAADRFAEERQRGWNEEKGTAKWRGAGRDPSSCTEGQRESSIKAGKKSSR